MGQLVLSGNPPVTILLRRSLQARRLSLRVSSLDGRVTLTLPKWTPKREAMAFAYQKEDWIRGNLEDRPKLQRPRIGGRILLAGQPVQIVAGKRRAAGLEAGVLIVPGHPDQVPMRVAAFLKTAARQQLRLASDRYAGALGVDYARITLRDTRSRWGSCSSAGNLMYSWRLIMASPCVLDYVAAHEVAHLREMNHGLGFWHLVGQLYPGFEAPRQWLRDHSSILHQYVFDSPAQSD